MLSQPAYNAHRCIDPGKASVCSPEGACASADLSNTVVVLPRVVPQVNDLNPDSFRTDDPRLWNVTSLAGLVQGFLNRTGATTLPSLTEWTILPDKVRSSTLP